MTHAIIAMGTNNHRKSPQPNSTNHFRHVVETLRSEGHRIVIFLPVDWPEMKQIRAEILAFVKEQKSAGFNDIVVREVENRPGNVHLTGSFARRQFDEYPDTERVVGDSIARQFARHGRLSQTYCCPRKTSHDVIRNFERLWPAR